jgi:glyoxalase superfamily protein
MPRRFEIVVDSQAPARLARFWASALPGYAIRAYDAQELARLAALGLTPETDPSVAVDGDGPTFWFQKSEQATQRRNRIHLDLRGVDRESEVQRLLELGATIRDRHLRHTVMLDPEGNQFCVHDEVVAPDVR